MRMRPVLLALGIMTALLGAAMLPCALVDYLHGAENWQVFLVSGLSSMFIGACLAVMSGGTAPRTGPREAFFLTVLIWVVLPAIAAIPMVASHMSITDAWFESVSGLTTTGATVLTGLDDRAKGLLLWRAILQWIGGIGIIVTAIAILPMLRVGGMQLFQLESSDTSGKFMPRVGEIAAQTGFVYLGLSVLCAFLYFANGMTSFDAIAHAMTTMAAGGYSTHDDSFGFFGNGAVSVAILFMIFAGLPFATFVLMMRGQPGALLREPQARVFIGLIIAFTVLMLIATQSGAGTVNFDSPDEGLRTTVFNIVSVMTGTGYANANYDLWGDGARSLFLVLMFLGGCAGSAACGIKMFRLEISVRAIIAYAQRMISPHRLAPVRYGGRIVSEHDLQSVMVFVFVYLATFLVTAVLLGLTGLDPLTAISGAATSVSNVGPGLGPMIGPSGTFQQIPELAKWICSGAMLLGRLEFVAVFVVLSHRFWRG